MDLFGKKLLRLYLLVRVHPLKVSGSATLMSLKHKTATLVAWHLMCSVLTKCCNTTFR